MHFLPLTLGLAGACGLLAGCAAPLPVPGLASEPQVTRQIDSAPPGAEPGTCWGKHAVPAIYETVTQQVMLQPAEILADGTVVRPAIYKTETHQAVVRERKETWFEVPCDAVLTPDFIASLQRALKVRGLYRGTPNGAMDGRTRAAIRRYQKPQGLDSGILSIAAARKLGLIAVANPKE
ncbi:peptidoglycan-binding domain-containing protein [Thalassovita aquimarina]|uniref:Peptidoglycan-binding protein n=1 Tax=Thalassovita aquimarina TaxID=2785917 RepID=A0ABS5HV41_9RHOB|nr:peptidoglycan-binding domain-containing protein [Thalassovita aquimarina]MBR9652849.1 peptidoglycan-binding protein [Thalassovita aquimarina]